MTERISISLLAKQLNVSPSLVSLVLNGRGNEMGISSQTQARVHDLTRELNYRPNRMARGLRLRKSDTIGLILPNISDTFFTRIANSVEASLGKRGYTVLFCNSLDNGDRERERVSQFLDQGVDGLIVVPTLKKTDWIEELIRNDFPFVLVDRHVPLLDSNFVVFENFEGSLGAVNCLLEQGCLRIAQLTLESTLSVMEERSRGYHEALRRFGCPAESDLTFEIDTHEIEKGVRTVLVRLFQERQDVDGLFTHNNVLAEAVLEMSIDLGLQIPRDFKLVSFGDQKLFKVCSPPVSCVRVPVDRMAEKAVEILINEIESDKRITDKVHHVFPTRLIVRESCGSK